MRFLFENIVEQIDGEYVPVISINNGSILLYSTQGIFDSEEKKLRIKFRTGENGKDDVDIQVDSYSDNLQSMKPAINNIYFKDLISDRKYVCSIGIDNGIELKDAMNFFKGKEIKKKFELKLGHNKYDIQRYVCKSLTEVIQIIINLVQEDRNHE